MTNLVFPTDDTVATITAFNSGCDPQLVARKYAAMRQSVFAFMRGTCHLFYETWPDDALLDTAPRTWLSGDLHVENFGTYKGDNRLTYFDVTDFDESVLGPVTWDVGRFLSSILIGAGDWGLGPADARSLASKALLTYSTELASGKASWIERENARGVVKRLFAQVAGRSRTDLLDRFTTRKGKRRRLTIDAHHTLAATDEERATIEALVAALGAAAGDQAYFTAVDVARRISGLGSMAYPRYIALVEGRGSPDRNVLLTIKSAHASSLVHRVPAVQPEWLSQASRIATVQRHCSAVPPAFLQTIEGGAGSYVVRELQPVDDRVRLRDWDKHPKKLGDAILTMAAVGAWMHLRSGAWRGSASIDELVAFGRASNWAHVLGQYAQEAALRTERQFQEFARAYDAGTLTSATPPSP